MSWLSDIFGGGGSIRQALREGAVIIDLRTAYEYDQGHIPRSLNIPIDRIRANIVRMAPARIAGRGRKSSGPLASPRCITGGVGSHC